jgi:hypothetical protein
MTDYDPFIPFTEEATVDSTPGLGDAYEMANNALESNLGLDHWREQVMAPITVLSDSEEPDTDSDGEKYSDLELKMAIRASRQEYYGKRPKRESTGRVTILPTPSLSPQERARRPKSRFETTRSEEINTASPFRPSQASSTHAGPSHFSQQRKHLPGLSPVLGYRPPPLAPNITIDLTDDSIAASPADLKTANPNALLHFNFLDNTLGGLGRSLKEHTSDTVEGEL